MKRKLLTFLMAFFIMFAISSCEVYTYATTQDDIHVEADVDVVRSNVSFDVIIQYGTPYYRDGILLYYLYRDIYYYPFYYNNYWYVRAYRRPFTHFDTRPYFRPHRYDYKFSPGHYRGFDRPRDPNVHHRHLNPTIPRRDIRRTDIRRRPNNPRPDIQPRQTNPGTRNQQIQRPSNQSRQITPRQVTPNRSQPQRSSGNFGGSRVGRK